MDANFLICSLLALEQYCPLKGIDINPWGNWGPYTCTLKREYIAQKPHSNRSVYICTNLYWNKFYVSKPCVARGDFLVPYWVNYDLAMQFALFFYCYLTKQLSWNRLCQGLAIMSCVKKIYIWFETTTL